MAASLSDISLVTQVAVFRNKRAFDQIVRKYQSPVRRFLLNLTLGNEALSDDLAQDTFLKAYLNIGQFRGQASLQTWLMRIAYNVFYDYKRKAPSNLAAPSNLPPLGEAAAPWFSAAEASPTGGGFIGGKLWRSSLPQWGEVGGGIGHPSRPLIAPRRGAHLRHPAAHRRLCHRRDCRHHGDAGQHSEVAPETG